MGYYNVVKVYEVMKRCEVEKTYEVINFCEVAEA